MKFRTEISLNRSNLNINLNQRILTLGSCFADNIGSKLTYYKFDILQNPFGVLYNPYSIYNSLLITAEEKVFTENDLFFHKDEFHSFYHHSDFSGSDKIEVLDKINKNLKLTLEYLKTSGFIFITLGTAYVYIDKSSDMVVSNCHKIPQFNFKRKRLNIDEATYRLIEIKHLISSLNPDAKIIFTLSPVRHWKDGAVENQLSKSILHIAIDNVLEEGKVFYFPAYELLLDDLRDYRFYDTDLLHPNNVATGYIWEKFSNHYFDDETLNDLTLIDRVNKNLAHRPRNIFTGDYEKLLLKTKSQIETLSKKYPRMNFSAESAKVEEMLNKLKNKS